MEEEYNFYEEDINKVNFPKILIVLVLLILVVGGYFIYKYYVGNNNKLEETNEVSVTDPLIQKLYNRYNFLTNSVNDNSLRILDDLYGYYYREDSFTSDKISSEVKVLTALNELFLNKTLTYEEGNNEPLKVEGKVIKDTVNKLFANNDNFSNTGIDENKAYFCDYGVIKYNSSEDYYYAEGQTDCRSNNMSIIKTRLVKAEKEDDKVTFVEEMAYLVPEKSEDSRIIYNVYDSLEENDLTYVDTVSTLSEFAFYNYKHLHNYEYTFSKKGNDYILEKIERVK